MAPLPSTLLLLALSLVWEGIHASPAAPFTTPPPKLQRRDFPPDFIGYSMTGPFTYTWTCDLPATYGTDSVGMGGCCQPSTCAYPRACSNGYIIFAGGSSRYCGIGSYCITAYISTASVDFSTIKFIDCAPTSTNIYLVRATLSLPPSASGSSTIPRSTSPPTTIIDSFPIPSSTSTSPPSTTTTTPPSTSSASSSGPNKGAIAGGVVGGVILIAAFAIIGFLLFRRHRRPQQPAGFQQPQYIGPANGPPMSSAQAVPPHSPPPLYGNPPQNPHTSFYEQKPPVTAWPTPSPVQGTVELPQGGWAGQNAVQPGTGQGFVSPPPPPHANELPGK